MGIPKTYEIPLPEGYSALAHLHIASEVANYLAENIVVEPREKLISILGNLGRCAAAIKAVPKDCPPEEYSRNTIREVCTITTGKQDKLYINQSGEEVTPEIIQGLESLLPKIAQEVGDKKGVGFPY